MRKYDSKNKRNIGIIIGICILFAVIFSYFLLKEIKVSKIRYELEKSTVLFDIDKNNILLNETGVIKKKWNQKYFLTYKEEQYNIGTHVVAFNNDETTLYLYGEFYQINSNSEVDITKEETIINNLGISRFYKIADRKYLLVDQNIRTPDDSLKTTNYLIVELDKQGNAILYNNSLNFKVFSATKILTSGYTFDIANELLIFPNEEVDLKKIIGSTNQYKEEEPKDDNPNANPDDPTGEGGGGAGGNGLPGGNGDGTGGGNGQGNQNPPTNNDTGENPNNDITVNKPGSGEEITPGEIINQTSYTSIIRVVPYTNSISIDYVIYDKKEEYISTFIEIRSKDGLNVVHLPKNSTNITLTKLRPGTDYELTFKYTHTVEDVVKEETIDIQSVKTLIPTITLTGTKVTNKKIHYKIELSSYNIDQAFLRLYINGEKQQIDQLIVGNNIKGEIDLSGIYFPSNTFVELKLEDIYVDGVKIDKIASWSYVSSTITSPQPPPPEEEPEDPENPEEGNNDPNEGNTEDEGEKNE